MSTYLKQYRRFVVLLLIGLSLLFIDFFTKALIYYTQGELLYIPIFHNFLGINFDIRYATNTGAAWGMFSSFPVFLIIFRMVVVLGLLVYLFFINRQSSMQMPLILIITGAIGNILDFFLYGYVIDFFAFNFWGYAFPLFNVADSMITIGVVWIFANTLLLKKRPVSA